MGAGAALVLVLLLTSVRANFGDDPVLRLQGFDRARSFLPTSVSCGSALTNLAPRSGTRALYDVARDNACHNNGVRRFWMAVAFGGVMIAAGFTLQRALAEETA